MKLRLTYSKTGLIRFISHRDLIPVFFRAFSRAGLPVAYSRGFSPHPLVSFCPPLKVGMEGLGELLDLELTAPPPDSPPREDCPRERQSPDWLPRERQSPDWQLILNNCLPEGLEVKSVQSLSPGEPSLHSRLEKAVYRVAWRAPFQVTGEAIKKFLAAAEVPASFRRGKETRIVNARQGVEDLTLEGEEVLRMVLSLPGNGRPYPVLAALSGGDPAILPGLSWQRLAFLP